MGVSLQSHPDVIEAGRNALRDYGAGLSSVRFICGTQVIKSYNNGCGYNIQAMGVGIDCW